MSYEPRPIYNIKNNLSVKEYESLLVRLNIYITIDHSQHTRYKLKFAFLRFEKFFYI